MFSSYLKIAEVVWETEGQVAKYIAKHGIKQKEGHLL